MALNPEQMADFDETFRMFDKGSSRAALSSISGFPNQRADNDGHITRAECYALLQKLGQSSYEADATIAHMLGSFDRNQSSTIDKDEFIHYYAQQQAAKSGAGGSEEGGDHAAKTEFGKYDTNKDGHICKNELKGLLAANNAQRTDAEVDSMLGEVDSDKDGKINYKEFAKIM